MHLKAHRYFAKVAVSGSFIATARHFQVPPSSVSRFIAALEQELGQQLLYRNTRGVTLTEAGERYYSQIREVIDLLDAADESLRARPEHVHGVVRLNAPLALGTLQFAGLLDRLHDRYPGITVELTLTDAFIDPVQEGADITVRVGHMEASGLIGRKVADQRYVLAASATYVARHGRPQSPQDLTGHACLVYKGRAGAQRWYFSQPGQAKAQMVEVQGPLLSNNAQVLASAARAGRGIVLFPSWLFAKDDFSEGKLVHLLPDWQCAVDVNPSPIHLLSPENRLRSLKVQAVTAFLLEAIRTPPYWDDLGIEAPRPK
ncbi:MULTISPECIES: LysR family transcriptional regulator [Pseudomonas]|uniref:LysR family transcriptional regulator n=1 Tax=Pseudomonas TaxID=286 RepID=UPI0018A93CD7|nr:MULTISPECIES: LysR family transcriptional regulator [Pseudomonas]MBF8745317.1 LysR family transcriptional regulator [Pseudomonas monteilii]MCT8163449.1 LysR family transcriptional regulator [Pseudomonas sp. HD6422]MCT8182211.1 LysR family transcriptional regulator [Pseudomonas sp. HD6421]